MTISTEDLRKLLGEATPGPWRVEFTEADGGARFIYSGHPGDAYCVARMMRFTGGTASDTANAALTAAAPDLAAELITARAKLEAAEKLAEAARYFYEYGENDRAVFDALATWDSLK